MHRSRLRTPLAAAALAGLVLAPISALAAAPPDSEPDPASADTDEPDAAESDAAEPAEPAEEAEPDDTEPPPSEEEPEGPAGLEPGPDATMANADADAEEGLEDDAEPPALANPLPPKHRIAYNNVFVARLNPLGLINRLLIDYRYRLYDTPSRLKNGSYIGFGIETQASPALVSVRPQLTIQPAAVLKLRAGYGLYGHFGTFDLTQSFPSPTAEHYGAELEARGPDNAYANIGGQGVLGALVQAKVWQIAIRNDLNFFVNNMNLRDGDTVWYDQMVDMVLEGDGWFLTNDSDILWVSEFGLVVGVRNTVTKSFYKDSSFLPGESTDDPNGPTNRVGPLLAYTFYDKPNERPRFNRPSILLISQWWTNHRYRTGALLDDPYNRESITINPETGETEAVGSIGDGLPAMPYFILGFAFEGDLFQVEKGQTVPMDRWKARRAQKREERRNKRNNKG